MNPRIENERKSAATTTAGEIESGRSRGEWWAEKEKKGSSIIQSPTVGQKIRGGRGGESTPPFPHFPYSIFSPTTMTCAIEVTISNHIGGLTECLNLIRLNIGLKITKLPKIGTHNILFLGGIFLAFRCKSMRKSTGRHPKFSLAIKKRAQSFSTTSSRSSLSLSRQGIAASLSAVFNGPSVRDPANFPREVSTSALLSLTSQIPRFSESFSLAIPSLPPRAQGRLRLSSVEHNLVSLRCQ